MATYSIPFTSRRKGGIKMSKNLRKVRISDWKTGNSFTVTTGQTEHRVTVLDPDKQRVEMQLAGGKTVTGQMEEIKQGTCLACLPVTDEPVQPITSDTQVRTIRRRK